MSVTTKKKKLTSFQKEQFKNRKLKLKAKRDAMNARLLERKIARKAKKDALRDRRNARAEERRLKRAARREARAAPKRNMKWWSNEVRTNAGNKCEVCGVGVVVVLLPDGTPKIGKNGNPVLRHLDSHHVVDRSLYKEWRFDPRIGVLLCKRHHKYGRKSAHKNAVWFTLWLFKHRRATFDLVRQIIGNVSNPD